MTELFRVRPRRVVVMHGYGYWMNCLPGDVGDVLRGDAIINNDVMVDVEVIDDGRLIVNLRYLGWRDAMAVRMRVTEIFCRDKCEEMYADAEIKSRMDRHAIVNNSSAFTINGVGW
jgi:hypothetical protein